jgi:hypothetical protein
MLPKVDAAAVGVTEYMSAHIPGNITVTPL